MTLKNLSKIATSSVYGTYKIRWLRWWNSSPMLRVANHYLPSLSKEKKLKSFFDQVSLWAHVFYNILISYYI